MTDVDFLVSCRINILTTDAYRVGWRTICSPYSILIVQIYLLYVCTSAYISDCSSNLHIIVPIAQFASLIGATLIWCCRWALRSVISVLVFQFRFQFQLTEEALVSRYNPPPPFLVSEDVRRELVYQEPTVYKAVEQKNFIGWPAAMWGPAIAKVRVVRPSVCLSHANISETKRDRRMVTRKLE